MIVHLDSNLIEAGDAKISVFDRGFLFGDGIYEGLRATRGHIIGLGAHAQRMAQGLEESGITGFDASRLGDLSRELLEVNSLDSAFIYWQVTRGTPRDGASRPRIPTESLAPTVFGFVTPVEPVDQIAGPKSKHAALIEDCRWTRGHLKSISLMGSVLIALDASGDACDDAIIHRGGVVSEGTATNLFAAFESEIATPSLESASMLEGVTRALTLEAMPEIVERPVSVDELGRARELMLVGTRTMVASVVSLDGKAIGSGEPGPVAQRMHESLVARILQEAGQERETQRV